MIFFRIIKFTVNIYFDINTGFNFKNWYYIIVEIKLQSEAIAEPIYLNINYSVILIDKTWLEL